MWPTWMTSASPQHPSLTRSPPAGCGILARHFKANATSSRASRNQSASGLANMADCEVCESAYLVETSDYFTRRILTSTAGSE